jgi:tetratricopeptide (TPR) repeat protein
LAVLAAVATVAILFSRLPLENSHRFRTTHYLSIAIELSKDPAQAGMAMDFYQRALDAAPALPSAELGLGVLLARAEDEAISRYRKALVAWPEYVEARYDLGRALAATGRHPEAAQEFAEALRLRLVDADAHIEYGRTLNALGRFDLALEHLQQGPRSQAARYKSTRRVGSSAFAVGPAGRGHS